LGLFTGGSKGAEIPALIQMDAERLAQSRRRIQAQDAALQPAHQTLVQAATQALLTPPTSVMDKSKTPPSGDKHDYFSIGPYFWPNPNLSSTARGGMRRWRG
jgi:hypothetical protein